MIAISWDILKIWRSRRIFEVETLGDLSAIPFGMMTGRSWWHWAGKPALRARMKLSMHVAEAVSGHMGVNFRGADAGVA